jgi:hypothetical protein
MIEMLIHRQLELEALYRKTGTSDYRIRLLEVKRLIRKFKQQEVQLDTLPTIVSRETAKMISRLSKDLQQLSKVEIKHD